MKMGIRPPDPFSTGTSEVVRAAPPRALPGSRHSEMLVMLATGLPQNVLAAMFTSSANTVVL